MPLLLGLAGFAIGGDLAQAGAAALFAGLGLALWCLRPGRALVLLVSVLAWLLIALGLAQRLGLALAGPLPLWLAVSLAGLACGGFVAILILVVKAVLDDWRNSPAVWAAGGPASPTIEWEWVHVGRGFAVAHPLSARLGAVWWVVAWIAAQPALLGHVLVTVAGGAVHGVSAATGIATLLVGLQAVLSVLTLIALVLRAPVAWGLVWLNLFLTLPLSVPLMVYWADGVRPNLIYRHRFERLRRPPG